MMFNLISAYSKYNRGIGFRNKLPWPHIREDMNIFNKITSFVKNPKKKNAVIMGRKTWDSLPKKPLPNRINIILTNSTNNYSQFPNTLTSCSLDNALNVTNSIMFKNIIEDVFIIGGQKVYEDAIKHPNCNKVYITEIPGHYEADTFFPKMPGWIKLVEKEEIYSEKIKDNILFKTYKNMSDPNSLELQYLNSMKRILEEGEFINDRTGVGTLSVFDENMRFTIETLNPNETDQTKLQYRVPALTTKSLYMSGIVWELIWFLKGNTDAKWLQDKKVHIWDGNTSREYLDNYGFKDYPEGELGPGYGHQWVNWGGTHPIIGNNNNKIEGINQIKRIINLLREKPATRRAVLSAWNVSDLDKMALVPCHMMYIFKISDHNKEKKKLNCKVIIRSNDMFLGNPFNIMSTTILTILMSRVLNMLPGTIAISISDAHIYKNHIEQTKQQLERVPLKFPILEINKSLESYEDMCKLVYDDFKMKEYYHWPKIKAEMAA